MTPIRQPLAPRRPSVLVPATINGTVMTIGVGFDPATGRAVEAFADIARGNDQQHLLSDACVVISIALQHGITVEALEKSLGRVPGWVRDGDHMVPGDMPASAIGVVLQVIREVEAEVGL